MKNKEKWSGVFPAVLIPFKDDYSIDEPAFRKLVRWVADHKGINGIVVNGHTGEIMTLLPHERAEAVRIAADELKGKYLSFLGFLLKGQLKQSSMQKPLKKLVEKVYCSCRHIHG